jgi:hypothetical protein
MKTGLAVAAAVALLVAALAIGRVVLTHHGAARAVPVAATPSMPSPQSTQSASSGAAALPVGITASDFLQPYRSMTLDRAFEAIARQVRFEPYAGIQRGARGTALAHAGNAIDQALLLAAVLRAAGYEVRFVRGSLPPQNVAALLRGLYPPTVPSGVLDAEYLPYDASGDARLAALVRDHYWVEVNQGATWLPLDPSFPRAKVGEAYGTATDRFSEPPPDLYQRITFAWNISTATRPVHEVARWTGTVADVGLQPIGLVVDGIPGSPTSQPPAQPSAGGMFGGALTGAAPPHPAAEQRAADQAPTAIRYVRSVETDRLRPAAGNVTTASRPGSLVQREWVDIKITGPGGMNRTLARTLYAAAAETTALHATHRRYTFLVVPGPVSRSYVDGEIARSRGLLKLDQWRGEMARLQSHADSDATARTALQEAKSIETAAGGTAGYLMTLDFAATSDAFTDRIAEANLIAVARPLPRILIASSETVGDQPGQAASTVSLDLRLDEVQAHPYPGFTSRAAGLFLASRGIQESVLEGQMIARWTGQQTVSTAALMVEASRKRVRFLVLTPDGRDALTDAGGMTPGARSEIEATLDAGHHVIVPAEAIAVAGRPRWGWWDVDPASGAIVGVMEGGQHQAMTEYSVSSQGIALNDKNAYFLGCIVGSNTTMFLVCAKLLETGTVTPELIAAVEAYIENAECNTMCPAEASASAGASVSVGGCYTIDKFKEGMKPAIGASASLDFCAKYNEGFKCAAGLILAGLKGERPGVTVTVETKITLPCGVAK